MMGRNCVQIRLRTAVDAGELLGFLDETGSLGAVEQEGEVCLYWDSAHWNSELLQQIGAALVKLGDAHARSTLTVTDCPDRDWNTAWRASLQPICVGRRVLIRQSWNPAVAPPGRFVLVIDPKRAFGTGYHATTQLMVEALEDSIRGGESVLDVGTGSGILAMIALRLGAREAVGIDCDPDAIACAVEYASANGFGPELQLREMEFAQLDREPFDLVLANLDRQTLLDSFAALHEHLHPGGILVVSGLLVEDASEIQAALAATGWEVQRLRRRDEWMALELKRAGGGLEEGCRLHSRPGSG